MNVGVFIGRFQPFHLGHASVIETMIEECDLVVVAVGDHRHQSIKNPFSFLDRKFMIEAWWNESIRNAKLQVVSIRDNLYSEWLWKAEVLHQVNSVITSKDAVVHLYGHDKDASSYYLKLFPEWSLREVDNFKAVDATNIRKSYFESGIVSNYQVFPDATAERMRIFKTTPTYRNLVEEWAYYEKEKEMFGDYPYPQTLGFMCADALVVCQGYVILVKRKHAPGKGTWALPGGFKNRDETFKEACIRELREETGIRVPAKVLIGSIRQSEMFDSPNRNLGVPRVSMAYHIEIQPNPNGLLPELRPSSDAIDARWVSISDVFGRILFDDHSDIIKHFL